MQSLILTKGPQKTRISQTYMRVWEWVKSVWSPTHCDLAKSGQSHRESGWHEIFEGKIQALLIKAQCAVQWFLHRAPHQVCHIACCALSQLLVRQLTQIPADASDWQISYWQKLLFNTLPKGCTVLPALFTYYLKNPQYLWPLPLLQVVTTLYKLPPLVRSLKFTNHYFWEEKQRTFRVLLKQTCQHPKARKKVS